MGEDRSNRFARLAGQYGVILLYHGVFPQLPGGLERRFHNVTPDTLRNHLEEVGTWFRIVTLEAMLELEDRRGHAAVTFDDGNRSVFDHALPVLEQARVPATIFLNGANFQGKPIWRDKIRYLVNHDLVGEFLATADLGGGLDVSNFYRRSKQPEIPSNRVDSELDRFAFSRGLDWDRSQFNLSDPDELPLGSVLDYGNHGHHHYVMSSLDRETQRLEIAATRELIVDVIGVGENPLFSLPFGGATDYNGQTLEVVSELGFGGMLLSRGRLVGADDERTMLERLMPRQVDILEDLVAAEHRVLI